MCTTYYVLVLYITVIGNRRGKRMKMKWISFQKEKEKEKEKKVYKKVIENQVCKSSLFFIWWWVAKRSHERVGERERERRYIYIEIVNRSVSIYSTYRRSSSDSFLWSRIAPPTEHRVGSNDEKLFWLVECKQNALFWHLSICSLSV